MADRAFTIAIFSTRCKAFVRFQAVHLKEDCCKLEELEAGYAFLDDHRDVNELGARN